MPKNNKKNKTTIVVKARQPRQRSKSQKQRNKPQVGNKYSRLLRQLSPMLNMVPGVGGALSGMSSLVSTIIGSGAYDMKYNTLIDKVAPTSNGLAVQVPNMHSTNTSFRVTHKEYLRDIDSSTAFELLHYPINPGYGSTFPWLSSMAVNFTEYKFHGLAFEFRSTSATALNSTNTALGVVVMAPRYNVEAPEFISKREMEAQLGAVSCKPSEDVVCFVECAPGNNPLDSWFIRTNVEEEASSLLFYDIGEMSLATVGMQAEAVIGELWVTYDVELRKPKFGASNLAYNAHMYNAWGYYPESTAIFGTDPINVMFDNFPEPGITLTPTGIVFPKGSEGTYWINYTCVGVAAATSDPSLTYGTGMTYAWTPFQSTTAAGSWVSRIHAPSNGTTNARFVKDITVTLSKPDEESTLTFNTGAYPTTAIFTLLICQVRYQPSNPTAVQLAEERKLYDAFKRFQLEEDRHAPDSRQFVNVSPEYEPALKQSRR